jgi:hypothetical protein
MTTTTVSQLFNKFEIFDFKQVNWGAVFNETNQGIYVVALSHNPDKHLGISDKPYFNDKQIEDWINLIPNFTVDGTRATLQNIKAHLTEFWFPDESILYIGKAPTRGNGDGISNRINEYYRTIIGKGAPHSGGQWIKVLSNLNSLTIYYGLCNNPSDIEDKMLEFFMSNVSETTLAKIYDKNLPLPFANIKYGRNKSRRFKNERIKNSKPKPL